MCAIETHGSLKVKNTLQNSVYYVREYTIYILVVMVRKQ